MVTAGYINPEPLEYLCKIIDALNFGLKGFNNNFYKTVVEGQLEPVKQALLTINSKHKHAEIVNLVIPNINNSDYDQQNMVNWIKNNLGDNIPLYYARFVPDYKLNNIWKKSLNSGLKYVYIDNLPGYEAQNTVCPKCHKILIFRVGFKVFKKNISFNKCPYCQETIYGQ